MQDKQEIKITVTKLRIIKYVSEAAYAQKEPFEVIEVDLPLNGGLPDEPIT